MFSFIFWWTAAVWTGIVRVPSLEILEMHGCVENVAFDDNRVLWFFFFRQSESKHIISIREPDLQKNVMKCFWKTYGIRRQAELLPPLEKSPDLNHIEKLSCRGEFTREDPGSGAYGKILYWGVDSDSLLCSPFSLSVIRRDNEERY